MQIRNYHPHNTELRKKSSPPIVENWWAAEFNNLFRQEYGLQVQVTTHGHHHQTSSSKSRLP